MKKFTKFFKRSKVQSESVIYATDSSVIELPYDAWVHVSTERLPERKARKFTPSKEQQL